MSKLRRDGNIILSLKIADGTAQKEIVRGGRKVQECRGEKWGRGLGAESMGRL